MSSEQHVGGDQGFKNGGLKDLVEWASHDNLVERGRDLQHPARLGLMDGLDKGSDFLSNLRKAVQCGLSAEAALAALTTVPAELIGASDRVGRIAPGLEANFIIADGPFFESGTALRTTVVQGVRHEIDTEPEADVAGRYSLNLDGRDLVLELKTGDKGPRGKWWPVGTAEADIDSLAGSAKVSLDGRDLVLRLLDEDAGAYRLVGNVYEGSRILEGRGERPDGSWIEWAALRQGDALQEEAGFCRG